MNWRWFKGYNTNHCPRCGDRLAITGFCNNFNCGFKCDRLGTVLSSDDIRINKEHDT